MHISLLLLLRLVQKSNSASSGMDDIMRNAFGGSVNSIKVASLNIRSAPANQDQTSPADPAQEYPWVHRRCAILACDSAVGTDKKRLCHREALLDQVLYEMPSVLCLQVRPYYR